MILVVFAVTATRCSEKCTVTNTYVYFEPEYTSFAELRAAVKSESPRDISNPGKIYFKDGFLYISEIGKGIHVIDNRNPSYPVAMSFINIPGAYDLAINGSTLYADSFVDLVAIDISVIGQETEIARYNNIFQSMANLQYHIDPVKGLMSGIKDEATTSVQVDDCMNAWNGPFMHYNNGYLATADVLGSTATQKSASASVTAAQNNSGRGGSMARFAVVNEYLYALDAGGMEVLDVKQPKVIDFKKNVQLAWDIETIFPKGSHLFIGSQSGMHIYSIATPSSPERVSIYSHVRSCDPVVVEGDYAYVTLRDGSSCGGFTNQLEVIDLKNLASPTLVKVYPMTNPHGLGIDNNVLFICDGPAGLKIYDATDKLNITNNMLAHYKDFGATDLIPFNHVAMVIGEGGLKQYDYSDLSNIRLLSTIPIVTEE